MNKLEIASPDMRQEQPRRDTLQLKCVCVCVCVGGGGGRTLRVLSTMSPSTADKTAT